MQKSKWSERKLSETGFICSTGYVPHQLITVRVLLWHWTTFPALLFLNVHCWRWCKNTGAAARVSGYSLKQASWPPFGFCLSGFLLLLLKICFIQTSSGAVWGSVSCSRTRWHAAGGAGDSNWTTCSVAQAFVFLFIFAECCTKPPLGSKYFFAGGRVAALNGSQWLMLLTWVGVEAHTVLTVLTEGYQATDHWHNLCSTFSACT